MKSRIQRRPGSKRKLRAAGEGCFSGPESVLLPLPAHVVVRLFKSIAAADFFDRL
jgi:hypothetical protein